MAGFASPDVPAFVCYALIILFGIVVAVGTINRLLDGYPDHWAFASTWGLFAAHAALPVLLFWFLDYTAAIHDTSIIAAILVALGYRQIFTGRMQGVTLPGQVAGFWQPFETWVAAVADRIGTKQKFYLDRFDEKVRSLIFASPQRIQPGDPRDVDLAERAGARRGTRRHPEHRQPGGRRAPSTRHALARPPVARPRDYGWLLHKRGIVRLWRYWMWLGNGRAKLISAAGIAVAIVVLVGLSTWMSGAEGGIARRQAALLQYHQWRFLKANVTDRDQWRSQEFLAERLHAAGTDGADDTAPSVEALLSPLVKELRFSSTSDRQARSILALVVNGHALPVDGYVVPELIESLRTAAEGVRLQIRTALVAIQRADYPGAATPGAGARRSGIPRRTSRRAISTSESARGEPGGTRRATPSPRAARPPGTDSHQRRGSRSPRTAPETSRWLAAASQTGRNATWSFGAVRGAGDLERESDLVKGERSR